MATPADGSVTALIADDEPVARRGLRAMLADIPWITCVGEATHGLETVTAIDTLMPDLVLLDIQMPGLIGTEVLDRVKHQPLVIFTTAYAQHAVTAFELGALDYLLKPFGPERLGAALDKVRAALGEPVPVPPVERLREAMARGPMSRLFVRTGGNITPVPVSAVSWFEARGDYVAAHTGSGRHLLHVSLNHLESRLDPKQFLRIHRTHIVNLEQVESFKPAGKGRLEACLRDGTKLAVSRTRGREIRELGS